MALRPVRIADSTVAVTYFDPAIELDEVTKEDATKYGTERLKRPSCFREFLKFKQGAEPTVFEIGVVPPETLVRISDECPPINGMISESCRWRTFLAGVRSIKPWSGEVPTKKINGIDYVDSQWLATNFARGLKEAALDIGLQIWYWNKLTEDEAKN